MKSLLLPALALCFFLAGGCNSNKDFNALPPPTSGNAPTPPGGSAQPPAAPEPAPDPDAWPRTIKAEGTSYTIYQPQLDSWDGVTLDARAAVSFLPEGTNEATYGIIHLHATTSVDREERLVHFDNLQVTQTQFPSLPDPNAHLDRFQSFVPKEIKDIDLDRLEASLAISQARAKPIEVRNEPPVIIFAAKPTMLIPVEGPPHWAPVGATGVERIVNTRAFVVRDTSGIIYLHIYNGYVTARDLAGPWEMAIAVPPAVDQAKDELVFLKEIDLLAGQPDPTTQVAPTIANNGVPDLRIVTVPTELVLTEGEPKWTPLDATELQYIENTPSHVFKHPGDQQLYLLISGRWFKAPGEAGPWTFVPGKSLPADFAAIPDTSIKENVKASVPGTRQAQEAVIANAIPTTTKMERKAAKLDPVPAYDGGEAKLVPIDGTPLHFACNTATPVIQVNDQSWFACYNGVWFAAPSAHGPWVIADSVPAVIYTIPAASPIHYVTYVRVYRADAEFVWVGYTPGYYGTVIGADGTVVYGTGYIYPPYVTDTLYVAHPSTYGYSSDMTWTPWGGWAYGFSVGYVWGASWSYWGCMPPAPYWGPYWGYCYGWGYNAYGGITAWGPYGWAGTSGNIYSQHGPWSGVSRYQGGFNAWTGNRWASQYGRAYNSVTGTRVVGARGAVANIYTGGYAYGRTGGAYNENSGNAAWGSKATAGNAYTGNEVTARKGGVYNSETGDVTRYGSIHGEDGGVARVGDDVYAGRDGNVYKRGDDGSWDQVSRPQPKNNAAGSVTAGTRDVSSSNFYNNVGAGGASGSFDHSSLEREYNSRQMGAARAQSYQYSRPAFRGGGGRRR